MALAPQKRASNYVLERYQASDEIGSCLNFYFSCRIINPPGVSPPLDKLLYDFCQKKYVNTV